MPLPDTHAARSAILQALRSHAPAQPLPMPNMAPYLDGPYGQGCVGPRPHPAGLMAQFESAARAWRADVLQAEWGQWPQTVRQALEQRGCTRVAIGAASPLQPGLDEALQSMQVRRFEQALEHWKAELFDAIDASVTSADAGVADTGSLVLRPGPHEPRTLSLVPPVHVAVLMASRLYASLPAVMRALMPDMAQPAPTSAQLALPTNLLLVTGPSKTADIQQVLAYGAHGPKEVVIVLVNDLQGAQGAQP